MPRSRTSRKTSSNLPEDMPKIKMPFPPEMTAEEFLRNRPLSRAYFRSPNSFFIYRQQFVKQLKLKNYNDQMVKVSKWAGIFWSKEPSNVKEYYKNIEKDIQKLLNEQFKNEQNNPCPIIRPRFIFEYPNNMDDSDNENPSTGVTDVESVANAFTDWPQLGYFSESNSPTIPYYDELSTNFYPSFVPIITVPSASTASSIPSASPAPSASPVSPVSPSYPIFHYGENENIGLESCFTVFDELCYFEDDFSFFTDNTNQLSYFHGMNY
jgi:hypothetical protein